MVKMAGSVSILAVGDLVLGAQTGLVAPDGKQMTYVEFSEVTAALLTQLSPGIVLSPLMCHSFDCVDLAIRLKQLNFNGKYRILAPDVANPKMIRTEIVSQAAGLDVDLLTGLDMGPLLVH